MKHLQARFGIPEEVLPEISGFIGSIAHQGETLHKRYDETVSLVASFDPVLGFKLRSKNSFQPVIGKMKNVATQGGMSPVLFAECEQILRKAMLPKLEKAIIELGKRHSRKASKEVVALINRGETLDPEALLVLDELTRHAERVRPVEA